VVALAGELSAEQAAGAALAAEIQKLQVGLQDMPDTFLILYASSTTYWTPGAAACSGSHSSLQIGVCKSTS
jgi:hypothetical protein